MKTEKKRLAGIDLLKTVAILLVLFYHSRMVLETNLCYDASLRMKIYYIMMSLTGACVPIFFLASGYLMLSRPLDMGRHMRRTLHYLLLTLFWGALTILGRMVKNGETFSIVGLLRELYYLPSGTPSHLWFMGTLIIIYILFPLIHAAWENCRSGLYFFTAVLFVMTFGNTALNMCVNVYDYFIRTGVNPDAGINFFGQYNPFTGFHAYALVYFILGGLFREQQERILKVLRLPVSILLIVGAGLLSGLYGIFMTRSMGSYWDSVSGFYDSLFTLAATIGWAGLCLRYGGKGRAAGILKWVGSSTLGLYFVHFILRAPAISLFRRLGLSNYYFVSTIGFFIMLTILSSALVYVGKKIPGLRKLLE